MTDVRAPSAHASPRSLREHPRPCATLARVLGIGRSGTEPSARLRECASVVPARPPTVERRAPIGEHVISVEARSPVSAPVTDIEPIARLSEHVVVDHVPSAIASVSGTSPHVPLGERGAVVAARPPVIATVARPAARAAETSTLVEEAVPC